MNGRGYFVNVETTIEVTGTSHVRFVLDNPNLFGMDREEMIALYHEHSEPIGFEGKARAIILSSVLRKGWIRVRQSIGKSPQWTLETDRLDLPQRKIAIMDFVDKLSSQGLIQPDDLLVIHGVDDRTCITFYVRQA